MRTTPSSMTQRPRSKARSDRKPMLERGGRRAFLAIALAIVISVYAVAARAADHLCEGPTNLTHLDRPLSHLGEHLAAREPIKIVAIGSSSTAGAGASSPAASYPSRLAVELG